MLKIVKILLKLCQVEGARTTARGIHTQVMVLPCSVPYLLQRLSGMEALILQ